MIVAAMLVVAAAAGLLVTGVVRGDDLAFVYAAIVACLVAAVLLVIGVLRARPRRSWGTPPRHDDTDAGGPGQ